MARLDGPQTEDAPRTKVGSINWTLQPEQSQRARSYVRRPVRNGASAGAMRLEEHIRSSSDMQM